MDDHHKSRANRLRLTAARRGLILIKCRRRDPLAVDYGWYMLVDAKMSTVLLGTASIDEVEICLGALPQRVAA